MTKKCKLVFIKKSSKKIYYRRLRLRLPSLNRMRDVVKAGHINNVDEVECILRRTVGGHLPAMLMLQHLMRWMADYPIVYKTANQWTRALGLSPDEVRASKKYLHQGGIVTWVASTKIGRATHFWIHPLRFIKAIAKATKIAIRELLNLLGVAGNPTDPLRGIPQTGRREFHRLKTETQQIHKQQTAAAVKNSLSDSGEISFAQEGPDETANQQDAVQQKLESLMTHETARRLHGLGWNLKQIKRWYLDERTLTWLEYITQRPDITNPGGFIHDALLNDWQLPQPAYAGTLAKSSAQKTSFQSPFAGMKFSDFASAPCPSEEKALPEKCPACGLRFHCICDSGNQQQPALETDSDTRGAAILAQRGIKLKARAAPSLEHDAWNAAYNQLELQLDRASFETWLRPATLLGVAENDRFVIGVHNSYAEDMLQHRLYRNVRRVLSDVRGKITELIFVNLKTWKQEIPC